MAYQTIEVKKLSPVIGAEIHGVDLSKDLGNQQFQEIHDALMENCVVFFRDQKLTIDQHKDFGRRFGKLHIHPNAPQEIKEHPEILVIKADENSKHVAGEEWHSDVSCDPNRRWARSSTCTRCRPTAAATRCSPTCTGPTTRCRSRSSRC